MELGEQSERARSRPGLQMAVPYYPARSSLVTWLSSPFHPPHPRTDDCVVGPPGNLKRTKQALRTPACWSLRRRVSQWLLNS